MIIHDERYYESRRPIADLGPLRNFLRFIWDSERRAFLDRTATDWATVGLFYLCFFGVLISIFSLQLWITLYYITSFGRPYIHQSSLTTNFGVGSRFLSDRPFARFGYPGLAIIPQITKSDASFPSIWLKNNTRDHSHNKHYVESISKFLNEYNDDDSNVHYDTECSNNSRKLFKERPCYFDTQILGKCSQEPYGYTKIHQPCVYIKFNKRYDWVPVYYNMTSTLPINMPNDLKKLIKTSRKLRVWLSCDGATNLDKQHIGAIEYLPEHGFPIHYFPFMGQRGYLSPVVALIFKNVTYDRLITIECHAWAYNILHDRKDALYFQIMINK